MIEAGNIWDEEAETSYMPETKEVLEEGQGQGKRGKKQPDGLPLDRSGIKWAKEIMPWQ